MDSYQAEYRTRLRLFAIAILLLPDAAFAPEIRAAFEAATAPGIEADPDVAPIVSLPGAAPAPEVPSEVDFETAPGLEADDSNKLVEVDSSMKRYFTKKFQCAFVLNDGTTLPAAPNDEPGLVLRFQGLTADPRLTIMIVKDGSDPTKTSKYLQFLEFRASGISDLNVDAKEVPDTSHVLVDVTFLSRASITVGLKVPTEEVARESLRKHMLDMATSNTEVKLRLTLEAEIWRNELSDYFISFAKGRIIWQPYLNKNGKAMLQMGKLASRADTKKQWEDERIPKLPASDYFYDCEEAAIKLIYGSYLEYRVSLIQQERVMEATHTVILFYDKRNHVTVAAVYLGSISDTSTRFSMIDKSAVITDGTPCIIKISEPESDKPTEIRAISVPNLLNLPVANPDLVLLVTSRVKSELTNPWPSQRKPKEWHSCKLQFQVHRKMVRTQVNAINELCSPKFARWHPVLLNHEYTTEPTVDVLAGIDGARIASVYEQVMNLRIWNAKQQATFDLLRRVPGNGIGFIRGIFGCGKTLVQATLAKILYDLDLRVMIVAPTNTALRALSENLLDNYPDVKAIRIVADIQGAKEDDDNDDASSIEDDVNTGFRLVQGVMAVRGLRYNVPREHQLETHVETFVEAFYREAKTLELGRTRKVMDQELKEKYDAIGVYRQYKNTDFATLLRDAKTSSEKEALKQELKTYKKALEVIEGYTVAQAKVLLCTAQMAVSDLAKHHFAEKAINGAVVIADEDGQTPESMAWAPLVLQRYAEKIKGSIRFGDPEQLRPFSVSTTSGLNEFGPQYARSLLARHLNTHDPAVSLNTQYRMHPLLAEFPNQFLYGGELETGPLTTGMDVDATFAERMKQWIEQHSNHTELQLPPDAFRLLGINVANSTMERDSKASSRLNKMNTDIVGDMLQFLFKEPPYPKQRITIITPYKSQIARYYDIINRKLHAKTGLPFRELPQVSTIDSIQGHESSIVICDWVNIVGESMGFVGENRRANVALTRVRASLIIVFGEYEGHRPVGKWKKRSERRRKDGDTSERHPMVVAHWRYLKHKKRVVNVELPVDEVNEKQLSWNNDSVQIEEVSEDVWNAETESLQDMKW